ncbi:hypothetical protein FHG87_003673 [Trinorchestia longiramus]|nr:hypothetical protein FHG87_003673 [Trinorchestia longiramus]
MPGGLQHYTERPARSCDAGGCGAIGCGAGGYGAIGCGAGGYGAIGCGAGGYGAIGCGAGGYGAIGCGAGGYGAIGCAAYACAAQVPGSNLHAVFEFLLLVTQEAKETDKLTVAKNVQLISTHDYEPLPQVTTQRDR